LGAADPDQPLIDAISLPRSPRFGAFSSQRLDGGRGLLSRHAAPALYFFPQFVVAGGLITMALTAALSFARLASTHRSGVGRSGSRRWNTRRDAAVFSDFDAELDGLLIGVPVGVLGKGEEHGGF
jgi:hypothetical protein